ncbi:N-acetylglucosamine-specific PTS transporter subunit IIBC [Trueperella pecoris]|uniref:N-acetylglucosamine-specific PTS transporter subunit IIBC n=1 Tax=Trueperella pecoris TaxID=2733571 RepID=UPI0018A5CE88|nr:N-acetylglucosamine-specific PTS transporter subunit IIBC [Trueperella pecoris]QOQ38139.1 PTS transporter subunit EIIC [Trueperella pecoris]
MGGKTMEALQKLGRALMGAVAVMPVAAILMGIGYWIDPSGWGSGNIVAAILIKAGAAILDNLGWLFAIAIAFGLAKDHHGAAALSGFLGFATVKLLIGPASVAGYKGIKVDKLEGDAALDWASQGWNAINDKNVLIGILIGILAAWTYNRFHSTKLPDFLAFFSGRRLVPIMMTLFSMVLALVLYFVWPVLYYGLFSFGQSISDMGAIGAGIYGFVNRLLIPTGLHHAVNSIFWFDVIGLDDIGNFFRGGDTIAAAAAATSAATCPGVGIWDGSTCTVIGEVGRYQAGFFPVMMFGLPGAALAMYLRADSAKKKTVGSLMIAGALASFFTGVTEPLEFAFMFVAPLLYLVHALLTGLSLFLAATFHWTAGFGFSAGFVDMFLSSRNPLANQWYMLIVLGVIYFVVYFGIFYFLVSALNLKTPGRGDDEPNDDEAQAMGKLNDRQLAERIIAGLGGPANIATVDYCATRLRGTVNDQNLVDERALKATGVAGVVRPSAKNIQVVVGPNVQFVYDDVAALLRNTQASLKGEQEE